MSFQTRKTFIHLWNTNKDLIDEIGQISVPPLPATQFDASKR